MAGKKQAVAGTTSADGRDAVLAKMRQICLALPEAVETSTWGQPHFRVRDKIFAGCGAEEGEHLIGFKLEPSRAAVVVQRPGFRKSKYGGHWGWVNVEPDAIVDWDEIEEMVRESYRLIAPKRLSRGMDSATDELAKPKAAGGPARGRRSKLAARGKGKLKG